MKKFIVAGNWKMNKTSQEADAFLKSLLEKLKPKAARELLLFPSFLSLPTFQSALAKSFVQYGGQNCYFANMGAFTGEVSPTMLKAVGATHCLVGHSERRTLFGETNLDTAKKIQALQETGLTPVLCVGETESERTNNTTLAVIEKQLIEGLSQSDFSKPLILAYEPVWAIGTGKVATAENIREVHAFIHQFCEQKYKIQLPILYGGSVNAKNCRELEAVEYVNGFLIGGASLDPESLLTIYGG
ncbi:MAG: triose-phosphate isomerase [Bdellovibrionaceae bacterium]|nr:triose-phosphate isomerase [Pseudobdellovibrionaceae bacterium]